MPELPEVETVKRGLTPFLQDQIINYTDQRRENLRYPFPKDFSQRLNGAKITGLRRRAKYILIDLDSGDVWMTHLGMSGKFITLPPQQEAQISNHYAPEKHDHLILDIASGAKIIYNDPRRFGFMDLFPAIQENTHTHLVNIGPEPLSEDFNVSQLTKKLQHKKSPVKTVMLDQSIVAGLGNIYICETLWRAGIHPKTPSNHLLPSHIEKLVFYTKEVLSQAIEAGGSSLRDYRQANGELGYFQHQWDAYGREGETCRQEGCTGIIKRITQSGRSSFYCPTHQNELTS